MTFSVVVKDSLLFVNLDYSMENHQRSIASAMQSSPIGVPTVCNKRVYVSTFNTRMYTLA